MARLILLFLVAGLPAWAGIVAKVNGIPIYADELEKEVERANSEKTLKKPASAKEVLDRLILFHLAVQEATQQGLDRIPEVRRELDRIIYKQFLTRAISLNRFELEPTKKELKAHYQKYPMLRLSHLILLNATARDKKNNLALMKSIKKRVEQGESFKVMVLRYSQDASARTGGDLGYQGYQSLPEFLYQRALKMKVGDVSEIITHNKEFHLFQLADRKPFTRIPGTYLALLKSDIRRTREMAFLEKHLASLKKKAKIEILQQVKLP